MEKAKLVRRYLSENGQLIMPGVFDALSAKIAARAGFEVIFITGYSLSATLLGEPDFGLLTQTEVVSAAQRICSVVDTPVIVDADTGYGNAINVIRTVQDLIRAGAAGMFLEDQVWPKRCGHMKGKQVIPLDEQLKKLRAAIEARDDHDFFIVARTDSRQALGLDRSDQTWDRLQRRRRRRGIYRSAGIQRRNEGNRQTRTRAAGGEYAGTRRYAVDGARKN